jgi:hypothetical protein
VETYLLSRIVLGLLLGSHIASLLELGDLHMKRNNNDPSVSMIRRRILVISVSKWKTAEANSRQSAS